MKIVFISDTHNKLSEVVVPPGDILIHAGDFTMLGKIEEFQLFNKDLEKLPHKHKIVIAGNHEFLVEHNQKLGRAILSAATYLQDESVVVEGLKIYGSPWQPEFGRWAFNLPRNSPSLKLVWDKIPRDTDILLTHTPPHGILDKTNSGEKVGCEVLKQRLRDLTPRIHCFGHIHPAYGKKKVDKTLYINAAIVNDKYQPTNQPIVIEL